MWWYLLKRLGLSVVIVLLAIATLFLMLHSIPGDPVSIALGPRATPEIQAAYAAKMHLDQPLAYQFLIFLGNVLQGDLGTDVFSNRSVALTMSEQLPHTVTLAIASLGWAALIGIPLGCLSAIRPNSWLDRLTGLISVGTIAVPSFLVSIWAILLFSISLGWLPVIGAGDEGDLLD
ncbi:MAG: ABC transporter permease, partial [Geminicoccaceae bacterium]